MKIILKRLFAIAALTSLFTFSAASETVRLDASKAPKTLSSNSNPQSFVVNMQVKGTKIDQNGNVKFPSFNGQKFTVTASDSQHLEERIEHIGDEAVDVTLEFVSKKPKVYALKSIEGLESVEEYNVRAQSEANEKNGDGYITDEQLALQASKNKASGLGEISDEKVKSQKAANSNAGLGDITDSQADSQKAANEKAGRGSVTDAQASAQRQANKAAGKGEITDAQAKAQCDANKASGLGNITDAQVASQRYANQMAGRGKITNFEKNRKLLDQAQNYEVQKKFCHALGKYYDFLGSDASIEDKADAYEKYEKLVQTIKEGNPGYGTFTDAQLPKEWKALLIDAEQYASTISRIAVTVADAHKEKMPNTATLYQYVVKFDAKISSRYENTVGVIEEGFNKAKKEEWNFKPWPAYSVSKAADDVYTVNGVYLTKVKDVNMETRKANPERYYNSFAYPYALTFKYSVSDDQGHQMVIPSDALPHLPVDETVYRKYYNDPAKENVLVLKSVPANVIAKIESGAAHLDLRSVGIKYGSEIYGGNVSSAGIEYCSKNQFCATLTDKNYFSDDCDVTKRFIADTAILSSKGLNDEK